MDSLGKVPCMNPDRISNLPEEVTQSILGRLPIQDAVKTSILSRNWRHKFTTLPHLVFDVRTFLSQLQDEDKLVETISSILFQHKGPISKLSLSVKTMTVYAKIDQWLLFLSNSGAITEFILEFIDGSQYKIHSSLFSCANLRHLKLRGCIIPSPPPIIYNGFNNLTCLELASVNFNNEGFENLIAKCSQLSTLKLYRVDGLDRLNIHRAPKLEYLYFAGYQINQISLEYAPSLLHLVLFSSQLPDMNQNLGNGEGEFTSLISNLNGLSNLLTLVLGSYFLKFLAQDRVRMLLPSTFNHLWYLHFYKLRFQDMDSMSSVLRLIRSSPNLLQLVVTASTNSSAAQMKSVTEYLKVENRSKSLMRLVHVEMYNIKGLKPEMQFIKMMLGNSPWLVQMRVQPTRTVKVDRDRELEILKELIQFPRVSIAAKIVYEDTRRS